MKIHPVSLTEMYIDWSMEGSRFSVYRSTSPQDDFQLLGETDQRFFVDTTGNFYDENIRYYYRIEGYVGDLKVDEEGPETLIYNTKDAVAGKFIYEYNVVLSVMRNPKVCFLLKMREGTKCPNCWNPVTNRVQFADCDVCNGTGIIQGYHPPVISRISQDVSQLQLASGEMDEDKVNLSPIRAWIPNYPLLYPEDVMVDINNQRYKVVNVARRTKSQFVIRQVLDLSPLEKGHPAYNVEVDREVLHP